MNIVMLSVLLWAVGAGWLPVINALVAAWLWWLVFLLPNTWRDFMAGMTFDRLKHGGEVTLPDNTEERQNEPDAEHIVKYVLWPPAAIKNFIVAKLASALYYFTWPKLQDVGLTMLTNRMAESGSAAQKKKAGSVRRRWLDRYDRRGKHT